MQSHQARGERREDGEALARRLRESRDYLGLSQEAVARQLGVSRASITALESGKRKVSSIELRDLAQLYGTSVERLLGIEEMSEPVVGALYRTAQNLTPEDQAQVLRFAEFLRAKGRAPEARED